MSSNRACWQILQHSGTLLRTSISTGSCIRGLALCSRMKRLSFEEYTIYNWKILPADQKYAYDLFCAHTLWQVFAGSIRSLGTNKHRHLMEDSKDMKVCILRIWVSSEFCLQMRI